MRSRPIAAWGFYFQVESDEGAVVQFIDWCYGDLPDADGPVSCFEVVRHTDSDRYSVVLAGVDGSVTACGDGRDSTTLMELIAWEVNRRALRSAGERVVVHAASFAGPLGAVVLTAPSEVGKSTLAAAAARRGWGHVGDDVVMIDPVAGEVHAFARPLMLRPGGRELLGVQRSMVHPYEAFMGHEWFMPASALGAEVVDQPVPLVAIGLLQRGDGAGLNALGPAAALHALAQQSPSLARSPSAAFACLDRLARNVPTVSVTLGAPDHVLDLLAPMLGHAS